MPVDMSQIPPQTQQALAASQGVTDPSQMEAILAQLAQDPEALAAAMQQLGINVTADQLHQIAEDWVDQAADNASGTNPDAAEQQSTQAEGDDAESDAPQQQSSSAPAAADDGEADEGVPPGGADSGGIDDAAMEARAMAQRQAGGAAPPMAGRGGAVGRAAGAAGSRGSMDDLISAAMMQQSAAGDPNAAVPDAAGMTNVPGAAKFSSMQRPKLPHSTSSVASSDPRMKQMIANIYRSVAAQSAGADRAGAPVGPRTGGSGR